MADVTHLAPGVYVREMSPDKLVTGVSTNVCGFVGLSDLSEDSTPRLITSWESFQSHFGGMVWDRYLAVSVYNFFNEGGTTCYVVAPPVQGAEKAAVKIPEAPFEVEPTSSGTWPTHLSIQIEPSGPPPQGQSPSANPSVFTLSVVYVEKKAPAAGGGGSGSGNVGQNGGARGTDAELQKIVDFIAINNSIKPKQVKDDSGNAETHYILESYAGLAAQNIQGIQSRINGVSLFITIPDPPAKPPETNPTVGIYAFTGGKALDLN